MSHISNLICLFRGYDLNIYIYTLYIGMLWSQTSEDGGKKTRKIQNKQNVTCTSTAIYNLNVLYNISYHFYIKATLNKFIMCICEVFACLNGGDFVFVFIAR